LPYEYNNGAISITEPVLICQKAWANVAIVRNAIETQVEFSNSKIRVKSPNKTAQKFIQAWLDRINVQNFAEQFFRERHRSGNIFIYRVDGEFTKEAKTSLDKMVESKANEDYIPYRYVVLNPARIAQYKGDWHQIFQNTDFQRYSIPQNDWERLTSKALTNQFGKSWAQKKIVKLDPEKMYAFFYQKQDYETFSVPPIWPVLDDIELKLEFKKIDREVARTVENVILMVTHGTEPDKGGINPSNHQALRQIFQNPSVQRVLVADYTTSAEFIIPDLNKVLGKAKYEVVNEDIKEGLQFIMVGEDKFSNMVLKAKMFLAKLEKGQNEFIRFLNGEIERVCSTVGFRQIPKVEFEKINLKDEVQLQRVITRLYELGVLSVEETLEAIQSGLLPTFSETVVSQEEQLRLREKGLYKPVQMAFTPEEGEGPDGEEGRPAGATQPISEPRETRVTGSQGGKDESLYSVNSIKSVILAAEEFSRQVKATCKKKYKAKKLTPQQEETCEMLAKQIIESVSQKDWGNALEDFMKSGVINKDKSVESRVNAISQEKDLDYYEAAIIFHSEKK
jgi:hypothetical protein